MLDDRKQQILFIIIREHIKTGVPIGSQMIVDKYKLGYSPATVRNEMAELEGEGYIHQPHTSAGRIPTEKAYLAYVDQLKPKKLPENEELALQSGEDIDPAKAKKLAKELSRISGQAVFWVSEGNNFFYTGITNLMSQPEFSHPANLFSISRVIDAIDEVVERIFTRIKIGTHIMIGRQNPFSPQCSSIISRYKNDRFTGVFGILGPMRMNYEKNLSLIRHLSLAINPHDKN